FFFIIYWFYNDIRGRFNLVGPYPVLIELFAQALGNAVNRRGFLGVRGTGLRVFMGESWVVVVGGQRALPKLLEAAGFAFRWYDLEEPLGDVVG
ncbi:DUF1731 domain-containing protein, partial [Enterobacter mori]